MDWEQQKLVEDIQQIELVLQSSATSGLHKGKCSSTSDYNKGLCLLCLQKTVLYQKNLFWLDIV